MNIGYIEPDWRIGVCTLDRYNLTKGLVCIGTALLKN